VLYRILPKNGDTLSTLGFGCMRLPMVDNQIDEERAIAQIRQAIDDGINFHALSGRGADSYLL